MIGLPCCRRLPVWSGWGGSIDAVDWAAADMWQLGCCLWELLTGRPAAYYGLGRAGVTLADMMAEVGDRSGAWPCCCWTVLLAGTALGGMCQMYA